MKTKLLVKLCVLALAIIVGPLNGQQNQGPGAPGPNVPPGSAGPVAENDFAERLQLRSELSLQLRLTAEQEAQVARLREQQRAEIAAQNQNSALTQIQRREQIQATIRKYTDQISALLNPEQQRVFAQVQAQERDRLRTLQGDNFAERLQARSQLAVSLGLSAEQLRQIERIREQQRVQVEAANQNAVLTPEQRRDQITAAIRNYNTQVRALLNQEQIQQLDQFMVQERTRVRTTAPEEVAELMRRREKLALELGLSAEQEAQLARIREQQRTEVAALNQNRELTQEQRRAQIAAVLRKYGEQVRAMLKDDQLQTLDQLRDLDRDRDRTRDRTRVDRPKTN